MKPFVFLKIYFNHLIKLKIAYLFKGIHNHTGH